METLILICLLIVIALLVYDKLPLQRNRTSKEEKNTLNLPDVMGKPKLTRNLSVPNTSNKSHFKQEKINPDNLDIEFDENEIIDHQNSKEELDEVLQPVLEIEAEEEEWNGLGISDEEYGFAQGVTFEELSQVGNFLEKNEQEFLENETIVTIVQKLQGTALFSLLENSIENATINIVKLLDSNISSESDSNSSYLIKGLDDFDIKEFV
ncbi:conjugal transfer protein TraD [Empedobacter falsenii]